MGLDLWVYGVQLAISPRDDRQILGTHPLAAASTDTASSVHEVEHRSEGVLEKSSAYQWPSLGVYRSFGLWRIPGVFWWSERLGQKWIKRQWSILSD